MPNLSQAVTPEEDFAARSAAPGVVRAMGFDTNAEYTAGVYEQAHDNAWDPNVKASGAGSLRFDVKSNTGGNAPGSWAMNFSQDKSVQFGENEEFWIQWRQKFDPYIISHDYANTSGTGDWKQVIIGQGDTPAVLAYTCTENELVMFKSGAKNQASMYIHCGDYAPFEEFLGTATYQYTRQNMRRTPSGESNCQWLLPNADMSGCLKYYPNEWMTFMVHVKLGPLGTAISSVVPNTGMRKGYINSMIEFYVGRQGQPLLLAHRHENFVVPRGEAWDATKGKNPDIEGDPGYSGGWGPHDGHPNSKYGKIWLLPYNTAKDPAETHENASIWYDEVIVSRQRIPDPAYSGTPPAPTPTVSLSASPTTIATGANATLMWTSTDAVSCSASGGWSGSKATSGSQSVGPLTASTSYSLTCLGTSGNSSSPASATVTVTGSTPPPAVPTVTLSASPTTVTNGDASTLTWSSTNATSCTASGGTGSWAGTKATSGNTSSGAITATTTFTLQCTGAGGSASGQVTVASSAPATTPPPPTTTPPAAESSGGGALDFLGLGLLLSPLFARASLRRPKSSALRRTA